MLLLEVQDIPSDAEIYTLRTAKIKENHSKHVVRGVSTEVLKGSVCRNSFVLGL